jgi:hypothetical protein
MMVKLESTSKLQTAACMHIVAMCCSSIPLLFLPVDREGSFWAGAERIWKEMAF